MSTSSTQPLRVGFVGLGVMGRPMAANLARAGFPCAVYDINADAVAMLADAGAMPAANATAVAASSDVFVSMMVNDAQLSDTLFGAGAAAHALAPGTVVIGMSTMSRRGVQEIAARLAEQGVQYVDAPVSGGERGAQSGSLSIMVGGPEDVVARCRPLLDVLGSNVYHVGPNIGDGQAVKMINQLMVCVHNAVAAEALTFGAQLGLDQAMLLDIVSHSAGNSWILSDRGPRMVNRDFTPPKSALSILVKDIGFVIEEANALNYPLTLASAAHQLYKMGSAQGLNQLDDSVLITLMERLIGERSDEQH